MVKDREAESAPATLSHLNRGDWIAAALIVVATLVAYLPSLSGAFLWNDRDYVTKPMLRSLAGLGRIWGEPGATEQYYPLLHSLFWLQHQVWGDQALGYRLVSLATHAGAAVMFGAILRRLATPGAWIAALLFALHPVHVESVAWVAEQKNTFSLLLYLAAAYSYLRFDITRNRRAYAVALGLFLLSLATKTVTATLPAALLVLFWWQRGRLEGRRDLLPLAPWLVAGAAAGLFSNWVEQHYGGADAAPFALTLVERGLVAGRAFWFYAWHVVWPFGLNFIYPRWTPEAAAAWHWLFPLAAALVLVVAWIRRRRSRAPLAVALLFGGSLFPVLGFVNLYGSLYSPIWDHWQYLADLMILAPLGAALAIAWQRYAHRHHAALPFACVVLALTLGTATARRSALFADNLTLMRATIERNPECWMAYSTLGAEAGTRGDFDTATSLYEKSLAINPRNPQTQATLGTLLLAQGRLDEALAHLRVAVALAPDNPAGHDVLGQRLAGLPDHLEEAIASFREALRLAPDFPAAHVHLASALVNRPERVAEALDHLATAAGLAPGDPAIRDGIGRVLARVPGRLTEALTHFETALRIDPSYVEAHYDLGLALLQIPGRHDEGVAQLEEALRLRPGFEPARIMLEHLRGER